MAQDVETVTTKPEPDHIGALPFVMPRKNTRKGEFPRCFWNVTGSGDWGADCRLGKMLGEACTDAMRQDAFPGLLGWIVADQIKTGKFDAVMVGFWAVMARAVIAGD